ncbi:MAG: DNA topoisomerase, partial [Halobacteriaceae archaeon]
HPPIHPTLDIAHKSDLTNQEWEIYTLIARRFFATLADSALWQHLKVIITANDNKLKANGKRLLQPGYHEVYPYFATDENYVPPVEEGETITIDDVTIEQKETQPPQRYGQSKLIEEMESRGLGTKATRHNTIDKLYERGYIEGNPPKPTQLAKAVVEAAEEYADLIVDEEMTSQLEADMTAIAEGEKDLDEVTTESREILEDIFESLDESKQEIGDHLRASLKADKTIGPCPDCGSDLLLRNSQQGSYFVGCDGYPDCTYTLPLPNTGKPIVLDTICETHDLHEVKMLAGQNTFVHGCPRCQAEKAEETDDRIIGDCPACDSGELAIKRLESGSRLVGCTTYPECDYTLPLPRRGEIEIRDSYCDEHDLPELAVHTNNDDPWELGCPICNYQEYKGQTTDSDIKSIKGIGPKTAEKLDSVGISTKSELQNADPQEVAEEISGISADRLEDWQAKAN